MIATGKHSFLVLLSAFLSISLTFAESPQQTVRIGGITTLTGTGAAYGLNAQRGAELALAELNTSPEFAKENLKPKFEIVWEDESDGQAAAAVTAYKKLTKVDKLSIIFGPCYQDAAFALNPLAAKDNVILVSGSTPALDFSNIFSTWVDPRQEASTIARAIFNRYRTVGVLSSAQSWDAMVAAEFQNEFKKVGGEVVVFEEPPPDSNDVRTEALKVKSAAPEAIFISSYMLVAKYLKALQQLNVQSQIYGIELDRSVIEAAEGAANGVIFIGPRIESSDFEQKFIRKFAAAPDIPAYQAYDAMRLLSLAITETGSDARDIKRWLTSFSDYQGVAGRYQRVSGTLQFSTALYRIDGSSYQVVK